MNRNRIGGNNRISSIKQLFPNVPARRGTIATDVLHASAFVIILEVVTPANFGAVLTRELLAASRVTNHASETRAGARLAEHFVAEAALSFDELERAKLVLRTSADRFVAISAFGRFSAVGLVRAVVVLLYGDVLLGVRANVRVLPEAYRTKRRAK